MEIKDCQKDAPVYQQHNKVAAICIKLRPEFGGRVDTQWLLRPYIQRSLHTYGLITITVLVPWFPGLAISSAKTLIYN